VRGLASAIEQLLIEKIQGMSEDEAQRTLGAAVTTTVVGPPFSLPQAV
jgi:hypothetical protein